MNKLKIAVVGSGISGLSAAWLLAKGHNVTLFESHGRLGGHSHTVEIAGVPIDVGFIVFNERAYPNLTALLRHLDVATNETEMGFSVSLDDGKLEYSGGSLTRLLGSPRLAASQSHWRMLTDITRFYKSAKALSANIGDDVSLADFLAGHRFSQSFIDRHLMPMAAAIWSSHPDQMLAYPAKAFIDFFDNHQLLTLGSRDPWRTVAGGSMNYVKKLVSAASDVRTGDDVVSVRRQLKETGTTVEIHCASGHTQTFDHVVIAAHADQALAMIANPTRDEQDLLGCFKYSNNQIVLHRDRRFMPHSHRHWSSWNYVSRGAEKRCGVTYWMNSLQRLNTPTQHFVSLNPETPPLESLVDLRNDCTHPIFTTKTLQAQKCLWRLQGGLNTWFSGSYFGAGFHEDGLQSGLAVAEQLGGVARPWQVADPSGRIYLPLADEDRVAAE